MILFRKAISEDKRQVKELLSLTNQNTKLKNQNLDNCLVAEYDGIVIGVAGLDLCPPVAFINILSVHPDYQKQGYGDGLVRAIINFADRRNIKKILVISDKNTSGFFEKIGFVPTKETNYETSYGQCRALNDRSERLLELDIDEFFKTPHCKI